MKSLPAIGFLALVAFFGGAAGLEVGPVRLVGRSYITYKLNSSANNDVIECVYSLDEGEQLSRVFWKLFDNGEQVGGYVWSPRTGGKATGRLEGFVNLTRSDGHLQLTPLQYDQGGEYSCGVLLNSNVTKEAQPFQVLIVDINGESSLQSSSPGCSLLASYKSATVFPEATMSAGMYSKSADRYLKIVTSQEWLKVLYANKSMGYMFNNFTFEVNAETPKDVFFTVNMGFKKLNGEYINFGSIITNSSSWSEDGCPELQEGDKRDIYYFPGNSRSCRGGRKATTKATITCAKGYVPEGDVGTVKLQCDGETLTWKAQEGHTAMEKDLECVEDPSRPGGGDNGSPETALLSSTLLSASLLLALLGPSRV